MSDKTFFTMIMVIGSIIGSLLSGWLLWAFVGFVQSVHGGILN